MVSIRPVCPRLNEPILRPPPVVSPLQGIWFVKVCTHMHECPRPRRDSERPDLSRAGIPSLPFRGRGHP